MSKLVVITGLDGSGTSSVGSALAQMWGATLVHTPAEPFSSMRGAIDGAPRLQSPAAHYLFYLAAVVHADSVVIRPALDRGDVVCVRHLVDTVVSHRVMGLDVGLEYETSLYAVRRPDVIFRLDLDETVRQQRITRRGKTVLDQTLDDDKVRLRFLEEFGRFADSITTIGATHLSAAEIAEIIHEILKESI